MGGIAPVGQVQQHVGTHQKEKLPVGVLFTEMSERIDRIIHPSTVGFIATNRERRISGNSQFEHLDAPGGGRQFPVLFMRRHGRRQKPHGIQLALFPAPFRQKQMPVVDRIEAAAEDSESHGTSSMFFDV